MFSFATPLSAGGLFVNLRTWQAFGAAFVGLDHERTGDALYLWEKWHQVRRRGGGVPATAALCWPGEMLQAMFLGWSGEEGFPKSSHSPLHTALE